MDDEIKAVIIDRLEELTDFYVEEPILIPRPKIYKKPENKQNAHVFTSNCSIYFKDVENETFLIQEINAFLKDFVNISLSIPESMEEKDFRLLEKKSKWALLDVNNREGYNLVIKKNQIIIYAIHEKGIYYGIQTFLQLCKNAFITNPKLQSVSLQSRDKLLLPEIIIKDVPDLKIRGMADDISRGQVFTSENAKRFIKILSHYKMNFYCPYIEDMYIHPDHPEIGKDRAALTSKTIKEIDEYAKKHFVEFVPIFECLGHVDNILQHQEYEGLGEFPGAQCLDVSNPDIYPFLNDYISNMSKDFSTNYFHIGCDESFDLGKLASKEYIEEKGQTQVLIDHYNRLYEMCKEHGNRYVLMYDDIIRSNKDILNGLTHDMILMYWDYAPKKKYPTVKEYLDAGYRVVVSPSMLNWQRNFPDYKNSSINIINTIKTAYDNRNYGCLGVLTSTWGDMRYYSLRENTIFGALLTGDIAWNTPAFDYEEFKKKFGFLFYGLMKESLEDFYQLFTSLSSSSEYYYRFKFLKLLPPFFYVYFFKHPFIKEKYNAPFSKHKELGEMAEMCLEFYEKIQASVLFEQENFEYLQFGAELAKYLGDKIEISRKVSELYNNEERTPQDINKIIEDLKYIREKIRYLMVRYELLWTRAAEKPCLDVILDRFTFLIDCYDTQIEKLTNKQFEMGKYLPSEWIWANEKKCPPKPRYFKKTIELSEKPKKAVLQAMGCNHLKLYINGELIGEVISRFSMSILPIINRVKSFDITENLNKGRNVIAVEAYNYEGYKGAINLYGKLQLDKEIIEVCTDKSWISNKKEEYQNTNWSFLDYDVSNWKKVKSYGTAPHLNGDLFVPDILEGEVSNTQDWFGVQGYFYNALDIFPIAVIKPLVKKLLPLLIKILKPFG